MKTNSAIRLAGCTALVFTFACLPAVRAADVGRATSDDGSLLRRAERGKPWHTVNKDDALPAGELTLGLPKASFASKNGAVKVVYWTDWNANAPHPVIDTAVVLKESSAFDLDLLLDRGWIGMANTKKQGAAKVRVRTHGGGEWELTLNEPGDVITMMVYGRWSRGKPFMLEPGPLDVPTYGVVFLVIEGSVGIKHKGDHQLLREPPGPALVAWDSVSGQDTAPAFLDKLPYWAAPKTISDDVEARMAMQDRFRKRALEKGVDETLGEFVSSDKPEERRLGVLGLAALDDLIRLGDALRQTKYPDVWDTAVLALRHWIAREPGNDQLLYQGMIARKKWSKVEAETALQLLHSFSDEEVQSPELYETLIDYLDHDNLAIRGLAHWHLYRLAPAGEKIEHHPTDPKEKREAAKKAWMKLIPRGKLPPKPVAAKSPPKDDE